MAQEHPYPDEERHLTLLEAGGGELIQSEATTDLDQVIDVLRAASTFGYGVEIQSYWRHDHLDVTAGPASMEWRVCVWREPANLGRDLAAQEEAIEAEIAAERVTKRREQEEAARTVTVVCPGVGQRPSEHGHQGARCAGCGRDWANVNDKGFITRHSKTVLANGPEGQLTPFTGAPRTRPRRIVRATDEPEEVKAAIDGPSPWIPRISVVCPGTGKSVRPQPGVKTACPSCGRDNLNLKRYSPGAVVGSSPQRWCAAFAA